MAASANTAEALRSLIAACVGLSNDPDLRSRPAAVVWARAVGVDPSNASATAQVIRRVLRSLDRIAVTLDTSLEGRPTTRDSLVALADYFTTAHVDQRADEYFAQLPQNWLISLESCESALGGGGIGPELPKAALEQILLRVNQLEANVVAARTELGTDGAMFLLSLLSRIRHAVEECIVGGPDALIDLIDNLNGQTQRKRNLLTRLGSHPVTSSVLQLIAAVAAVASLAQGPSEVTVWNGPALPPPDVSVTCLVVSPAPIGQLPPTRPALPPTT